jgi:hypothetical protein
MWTFDARSKAYSMDNKYLDRTLALLATLSAVTVAAMVVGIVTTRGTQDFFQSARAIDDYRAFLSAPLAATGVRINLGLDNLFMVFYGAFFVVLAARLREVLDSRLIGVALAAAMLTLFLDSLENHHIMTVVHAIQTGLPVSVEGGEFQMVASQIKFHASYLAVLLFSLGLLRLGGFGRIVAFVLWCYIPCGVLISVVPPEQAKLLALGRTIFFVFAFLLSAVLFFSLARTERPMAAAQ